MSDISTADTSKLAAFNRRLAEGRPPEPDEPHTALEAVEALAARVGEERITEDMWTIARRIHTAEVADARPTVD